VKFLKKKIFKLKGLNTKAKLNQLKILKKYWKKK